MLPCGVVQPCGAGSRAPSGASRSKARTAPSAFADGSTCPATKTRPAWSATASPYASGSSGSARRSTSCPAPSIARSTGGMSCWEDDDGPVVPCCSVNTTEPSRVTTGHDRKRSGRATPGLAARGSSSREELPRRAAAHRDELGEIAPDAARREDGCRRRDGILVHGLRLGEGASDGAPRVEREQVHDLEDPRP